VKSGIIQKWTREGFGFIEPDGGGDRVYFKQSSVCNPEAAPYLAAGLAVEFVPAVNARGATSYHVRVVSGDSQEAA
jgi:cold shock CspA family protein